MEKQINRSPVSHPLTIETANNWQGTITGLSTMRQVEAAKKRMEKADAAIPAYVDRPSDEPPDLKRHRNLVAALREAQNRYMYLIARLRS